MVGSTSNGESKQTLLKMIVHLPGYPKNEQVLMKKKGEITIYDIASHLKVSPSTVSRALKDHPSIGKKTKKAIQNYAAKYGYQPNTIAASLRNNKTNTIGIIISWINRPFIASLISGIEQAANDAGYNVIITQSQDSYEKEVANAQALFAGRVEGVVISLAMETEKFDHFEQFINKDIPLVFVDRVTDQLNSDLVAIDNFDAGFKATEHLITQGCKRIAHLGGSQIRNVYSERQKGYIAALSKHNLPLDESLILHSSLSAEDGHHCAEQLFGLNERPDGVFSANDTAAVSLIQSAKSKGIKIPEELAVIGFNNDPISSIIEPQLSTIYHPATDMGVIAATQVLKHRKNKEIVKSESIVLNTELMVRASSDRSIHKQLVG
ncbi:LacI family transcriptional regulator [Marinoscillum furvescens DSM 4134]|uniref:LacI family transcriptional regulator n=2 Tax=Marinoscillum furvescens TaxID=1026 RepID=A0A3D9L227_MARFU|nr:LacI family transcriptional regulator [Marinoscillum furvescens DSM 4134]